MEWSFLSTRRRTDPFNEVILDVLITGPDGSARRIPAYWADHNEWRVRFAPPLEGDYRYSSVCSDENDAALHGREGTLRVAAYDGDNPLYAHGGVRVGNDGRRFEHEDGTPFFWLGDTWWMGLCSRLRWPDDFQFLAHDRIRKGFSVIQIVAGLYPDMPGFDERGRNEAGFPWRQDYTRINPHYFDNADLRISWLVKCGLVPCIVGCWGYYIKWSGLETMKMHWRNIIARWGAYPVVWCLAGEAAMPYYQSQQRDSDAAFQKKSWTEIARYVRKIDGHRRPITIHPTQRGREQVEDPAVLDFDMLQTGHSGPPTIPNNMNEVLAGLAARPPMPVVVGEVNYEGLMHGNSDETVRLAFWGSMLLGAAGFTYGANGIWQVNTTEQPFGPSPHGGTWGNTPWDEACRLPGSRQLAYAKKLFERYDWRRFEYHQEWVSPTASTDNWFSSYSAGIPGEVRVIYCYRPPLPWDNNMAYVRGIEPKTRYRAFFFDPRSGDSVPAGDVSADKDGRWKIPTTPTMQDWVLVLERL